MENKTFKCDGLCGAEKGEGNRWIVLFVGPTQFLAISWERAVEAGSLRDGKHICGQECAHKLLSQWLENNIRPTPENSQEAE